jgi:4-carboxymuconolactone decarboxylase
METENKRSRGEQVLREMLGTEEAAKVQKSWQAMCPEFERYVIEFVAGEIWHRPQLDRRTKSLATIAALAAMGRTLALELNIRFALQNGANRQDIVETLLQIAPYAGFPACWEGLAMAQKVFGEAKLA